MCEITNIYVKMYRRGNVKTVSNSGLSSYPDRHQHVHISPVQIAINDVRNALLNWNQIKTKKREYSGKLWCSVELYSS
jgi:hypothetical protein